MAGQGYRSGSGVVNTSGAVHGSSDWLASSVVSVEGTSSGDGHPGCHGRLKTVLFFAPTLLG